MVNKINPFGSPVGDPLENSRSCDYSKKDLWREKTQMHDFNVSRELLKFFWPDLNLMLKANKLESSE